MLYGLLVFRADTGALVFNRRFVRGFGLPGAQTDPGLGDPVGLSLQLYAFYSFCRNSAETSADTAGSDAPCLERLSLDNGGNIFFSSLSMKMAGAIGEVPLVLALFAGSCLPVHLGGLVAGALLCAFAKEHGHKEAVVKGGEDSTAAAVTGPQPPRQPRCGPPNKFATLELAFEDITDLFVADLSRQLPMQPAWLFVILCPERRSTPVAAVTAATPPPDTISPRPPSIPASRVGRMSPARRLLQRLPGGCARMVARAPSPVRPAEVNAMPTDGRPQPPSNASCRPNAAPHHSCAKEAARVTEPLAPAPIVPTTFLPAEARISGDKADNSIAGLAQGKVSWWYMRLRRGSSPRGASEPPSDRGPQSAAVVQQIVVSARRLLYTTSPGDGDEGPGAAVLDTMTSAVLECQESPAAILITPQAPLLRVDRVAVALPEAAHAGVDPMTLRRSVDVELRTLAVFLGFVDSLAARRGRPATSAPSTPRARSAGSDSGPKR